MTFLKHVFIVLFLAFATGTLHNLHAMDPTTGLEEKMLIAKLEEPGASDFQIYQLLLEAIKNNSELYFPNEVTRIIATNTCELTKKLHAECYKKYGKCLYNPSNLLNLLVNKFMSQATIVAILKACLIHSGKLLDQIQYCHQQTALYCLMYMNPRERLEPLKTLLLVAQDKAWDLITMQDNLGYTPLHLSGCSSAFVEEVLSCAPNSEAQWKLICITTNFGDTVLYKQLDESYNAVDVTKKLLAYAPNAEQAWRFITMRNSGGSTVLDLGISKEVREILESYRPVEPVKSDIT